MSLTIPSILEAGTGWAEKVNAILAALLLPSNGILLSRYDGADPEGVEDSTAAFVAAHADAVAQGRPLIIDGHYIVDPPAGGFAVLWSGGTVRYFGLGWMHSSIKVKDGTGDFVGVLGSNGAGTFDDIEVAYLTLDLNNRGNPLSSAASLTTGGNPRIGIYVPGGAHRVNVHHCRFYDGDNIWYVGSGADDTWFTDNIVDRTGESGIYHDHSSIYTDGERATITDNTFVGVGPSALTAIETHGSQQTVHDNHSTNYSTLANITGITAGAPSTGSTCHDNTARGCALGIILWSRTLGGSTIGLRDCTVHDNTIEIDIDRWHDHVTQKVGILFEPGSDLPFEDVSVHDNLIRFLPHTSTLVDADQGDNGVRMARTSGAGLTDRNVRIERNTVINPPSTGIYFNPASAVVADLTVAENTVVNPGFNGGSAFDNAFKVGLMLTGLLRDAVVKGNKVIDDQGTHTIAGGIDVQFLNAASTNVRILDNSVRVADGTNIAEVNGHASAAAFLRHQATKHTAPAGVFKAGSTILDLSTGDSYEQTAKPSGSSWGTTSDSAWVEPSLGAGWANFGSGWRTARYRRERNRVFVEGFLANTSGGASTATMFTLPVGFRPAMGFIDTSYLTPVHVLADGTVAPNAAVAAGAPVSIHVSFGLG